LERPGEEERRYPEEKVAPAKGNGTKEDTFVLIKA